ncbi:MAG: tetratricopeptide repeat protein [Candidatus Omnitrophica bacterium]|nr:tetratricopeptide repeat protein [Candidatus Omnitrophota bacterium]
MNDDCQKFIHRIGVIIFSLSIFLSTAVFANPLADQNLQKGDQYYVKHDNRKALESYMQAYAINPTQYEALMKLTRAYNDIGEDLNNNQSKEYYEKAVRYAELLQRQFPKKAEPYYLLSASYGNLALFRGGKEKVKLSRKVENNAKKAIELDPDYGLAYMVLGVYYREVANLNWVLKAFAKTFLGGLPEGTNQDSESMFVKALHLKPDSIFAHYELGLTYEKMKNKQKAIEYYKKTMALPLSDHNDKLKVQQAQLRLNQLRQP